MLPRMSSFQQEVLRHTKTRRFDRVLRKKDIVDSVSRFGKDLEARNLKMEQQTSCLLKTEKKGSSISRSVEQHPVYQHTCGVWEGRRCTEVAFK